MILLVGLGNPGEKFKNTRHNIGFLVIDALARNLQISEFKQRKKHLAQIAKKEDLLLLKPLTLMNSSGKSVKNIVDQYKVNMPNLWVIHDDLDIDLGSYKIQKAKGPKEHKGINSIENSLGKDDFWRVRVGVENRVSDNRTSGEEYVLKKFSDEEMKIVSTVIDKIVKALINEFL